MPRRPPPLQFAWALLAVLTLACGEQSERETKPSAPRAPGSEALAPAPPATGAPPATLASSATVALESGPAYVGAAACFGCHPAETERWRRSDHALAMQPADAASLLGDFADRRFSAQGVETLFSTRGGAYTVRTQGPGAKMASFPVAYAFGVAPLQQILLPLDRGRLQAFDVAWDARPKTEGGQRWRSLHPGERLRPGDPLHWTGFLATWNGSCAECHSTNLRKGYDAEADVFATTWSDLSVACEACHGPGSRHVAWAEAGPAGRRSEDATRGLVAPLRDTGGGRWELAPGARIRHRTAPRSSRAELETCARCHSRRGQFWSDVVPGEAIEQTHRVALLEPGLYHADGQIRDEVYEHGSFLQSRMHRAGVTCTDCHDPHAGRLRAEGNALCGRCHEAAAFDTPAHHHHAPGSTAARCVSCHMIERVYMGIDRRRDHSFRVPRPDLAEALGTPDACTDCHAKQGPAFAAAAVARWTGGPRDRGWHYARAIHAGRMPAAAAERELLRAVSDAEVPAIARATALSLLAERLTPASLPALAAALADPDPLLRRSAAEALEALSPADRIAAGAALLRDPVRSVRFAALSSLLEARTAVAPPDRDALETVLVERRRSLRENADRPEEGLNLALLEERLGDESAAERALARVIAREPRFVPARVQLADLQRRQGREAEAEATLRAAIALEPDAADPQEALGLSLVRQGRLGEALPFLARAAALAPDAPRYAYVHAVALHESGAAAKALDALVRAHQRHPGDRSIAEAGAQYAAQANDAAALRLFARGLRAIAPDDPAVSGWLDALERGAP